jgi:hypothetical protein
MKIKNSVLIAALALSFISKQAIASGKIPSFEELQQTWTAGLPTTEAQLAGSWHGLGRISATKCKAQMFDDYQEQGIKVKGFYRDTLVFENKANGNFTVTESYYLLCRGNAPRSAPKMESKFTGLRKIADRNYSSLRKDAMKCRLVR